MDVLAVAVMALHHFFHDPTQMKMVGRGDVELTIVWVRLFLPGGDQWQTNIRYGDHLT